MSAHADADSSGIVEPDSEESGPNPDTLDEVVSAIGAKVRAMRTRKGYSLQQLADRSDVSAAAIHKIERSGMVPTITTLMKVAAALNRPVSHFIAEDVETDKPVVFSSPENRRSVFTSIPGLDLRNIAGPYGRFFVAGAYATAEPGTQSGRSNASHPGEELVYLLEGALCFEMEDEEPMTMGPGDVIHFRGDHPHRWYNPGATLAKAVWIALRPM